LLRAFQFIDGFHGTDGRAWLLTIVRNTCYTWLQRNSPSQQITTFDDERHSGPNASVNPQAALVETENREQLKQALQQLPCEYREVLVLRELEGLSYKEIAQITSIPLGTVMSRLARARDRLQQELAGTFNERQSP
jgi:RNA polymerase sigma-70 factor (ECF subfamily)